MKKFLLWIAVPPIAFLIGRMDEATPVPEDTSDRSASQTYSNAGTNGDHRNAWRQALVHRDPVHRIQACWAAALEMDLEQLETAFARAVRDRHREAIAALGEEWLRRDPEHFVRRVSDIPIRGSSPSLFQQLVEHGYRQVAEEEPSTAFAIFQNLDQQSRLVLAETIGDEMLIRYLAEDPDRVKTLANNLDDLISSSRSSFAFTGDVERLANGLHLLPINERSLSFLRFLRASILTRSPNEGTQRRLAQWWRALPERWQIPMLPHDASDDLLAHPGLRERLATAAMNDSKGTAVSSYMHHYGEEWASENPEEALSWVLERFEGRALTGPPRTLVHYPGMGGLISLDDSRGRDGGAFQSSFSIPIRALTKQDPRRALEILADIPQPFIKTQLAIVIAEEWAKTDRQAALDWSQNLPGRYARDQAKQRITGDLNQGFGTIRGF